MEIENGEIFLASETKCAVYIENKKYSFNRYCPHYGADLLKVGYVNLTQKKIHCSWHNLAFDVENGGKSICGNINMQLMDS